MIAPVACVSVSELLILAKDLEDERWRMLSEYQELMKSHDSGAQQGLTTGVESQASVVYQALNESRNRRGPFLFR